MKIYTTIYGFYTPKPGRIDPFEFISINLNKICEVAVREPAHEIILIRSIQGHQQVSLSYMKEAVVKLGEANSTKKQNVFFLHTGFIGEELSRARGELLTILTILWVYVFLGVRYKLQEHTLKPEDLFGFSKDKELAIVYQEDGVVASQLAMEQMGPVFKGKRVFDRNMFSRILSQKAPEYRGNLKPDRIIAVYHRALQANSVRLN